MNLLNDLDWERWGIPAARILLILVMAWLAMHLLNRLERLVKERAVNRMGANDAARAATLARVVHYLVAVVIGVVAMMLVLSQVGISLAPILGAAGVVGLAIGFGAQSLVKDYFTGFFILFEDQIRTGDVVRIANISGSVEDITLRHVRLRDYEGTVHFVPNNLITTVSNMTREYANAVFEVRISYRDDIDTAMAIMHEVATQMRQDAPWKDLIQADLEMAGLERLDESAVVLRARIRTVASQQYGVRREYLRRLKAAFEHKGIQNPYPHVTMHNGPDTPAVPLRITTPEPQAAD